VSQAEESGLGDSQPGCNWLRSIGLKRRKDAFGTEWGDRGTRREKGGIVACNLKGGMNKRKGGTSKKGGYSGIEGKEGGQERTGSK